MTHIATVVDAIEALRHRPSAVGRKLPAPVCAVLIISLVHHSRVASAIDAVMTGASLAANNPMKLLRDWLLSPHNLMSAGAGARSIITSAHLMEKRGARAYGST